MTAVAATYQDILSRIRSASGGRPVELLAVSKGQTVEAIEKLYALGQCDFGENYVQELLEKAQALKDRGCTGIRWHFIGHLQTNKVKQLVPWVNVVHSVDSERLALELAKRWSQAGRSPEMLPIFIEVNIDEQESKSGVLPPEVPALAERIARIPEIELQGLMCIPDPEVEGGVRAAFDRLKALEAQCQAHGSRGKLSMGMSTDFEEAIRAGATHVRIGTLLFGPRATRV